MDRWCIINNAVYTLADIPTDVLNVSVLPFLRQHLLYADNWEETVIRRTAMCAHVGNFMSKIPSSVSFQIYFL